MDHCLHRIARILSSLVNRSRRFTRAGALFAGVGAITMATMAIASLGYATALLSGELSAVILYILPGVFIGIVFGFGLFGVVSLRTTIYSRSIGLPLLVLPLTFLLNLGTGIAEIGGLPKILAVVCVLALTMLATGYLLRTGRAKGDRERVTASGGKSAS